MSGVRFKHNECKLCGGPGAEKHRLYHRERWNHLRLQSDHEPRLVVEVAKGDSRCWLWERGIVSFLGARQSERVY